MMLGYLLRAGVEVLVLEKHADFLRAVRGHTVHPSTLEVIHELDLLEESLKHLHQEILRACARIGSQEFVLGDMARRFNGFRYAMLDGVLLARRFAKYAEPWVRCHLCKRVLPNAARADKGSSTRTRRNQPRWEEPGFTLFARQLSPAPMPGGQSRSSSSSSGLN